MFVKPIFNLHSKLFVTFEFCHAVIHVYNGDVAGYVYPVSVYLFPFIYKIMIYRARFPCACDHFNFARFPV